MYKLDLCRNLFEHLYKEDPKDFYEIKVAPNDSKSDQYTIVATLEKTSTPTYVIKYEETEFLTFFDFLKIVNVDWEKPKALIRIKIDGALLKWHTYRLGGNSLEYKQLIFRLPQKQIDNFQKRQFEIVVGNF